MKKIIIQLALFLVSVSAYCQSSVDSIFDYVVNDYLVNRIQTRNIYIQNRTTTIRLRDNLYSEMFDKDSINASPEWNKLITVFDSLNSKPGIIHKKNLNYRFISEKRVKSELNYVTTENGITVSDPLYGWQRFRSKYPDCDGLVELTYPSASEDNKKFILCITFYNASDKGFGDLIFGEKVDNRWVIIKEMNLFKNRTSKIVVAH